MVLRVMAGLVFVVYAPGSSPARVSEASRGYEVSGTGLATAILVLLELLGAGVNS